MSELRNLLERVQNQPLRVRLRQGANVAIAAALGQPFGLIHVIEYPKCGGSWVRNMLADYTGTPHFLDDRLVRPRDVIQVHRLPKPWYRRAVVVTRDPRDMYVSTYYHETQYRKREKHLIIERYFRHEPSRPLHEDFAAYLEAKLGHSTHPPFMLHEFVAAWRARSDVVWVRYEDCLANGEAELTRIVQELGLPLDAAHVRQAVESNSFRNATRARGKERKPGEADPGSFERKGVAGDWRNHFDRHSCELLERYEGSSLRALGYEPDASWIERFVTV
jgi:hypothetical protein